MRTAYETLHQAAFAEKDGTITNPAFDPIAKILTGFFCATFLRTCPGFSLRAVTGDDTW
jgi:hypothetical protein